MVKSHVYSFTKVQAKQYFWQESDFNIREKYNFYDRIWTASSKRRLIMFITARKL